METVDESLVFVGYADPTAKVEHGILIIQGKNLQKGLRFFEALPDAWWIVFVGFCIGTVQRIRHREAWLRQSEAAAIPL